MKFLSSYSVVDNLVFVKCSRKLHRQIFSQQGSNMSRLVGFLHYFHAEISNNLSEKPEIYLVLYILYIGLTVI